MKIPEGTQCGQKFRISGKAFLLQQEVKEEICML